MSGLLIAKPEVEGELLQDVRDNGLMSDTQREWPSYICCPIYAVHSALTPVVLESLHSVN